METARAIAAPSRGEARSFAAQLRAAAETLVMVAGSTVLGMLIAPRWGTAPVDLLYLVPVLAAAGLHGLGPGLLAAVASALAYNYFFTAPVHSFRIHSPADIVTVAMLFAVAVVTSELAARMRRQARIASANAARNATIAGFARRLLSCSSAEAIGRVACEELAALFECNAAIVSPGVAARAEVLAAVPADAPLTPSDMAAASFVLISGELAGRGAPRLNPAEWLFYPVRSEAGTLAAMGLARDDGQPPVARQQIELLTSLLDQCALALVRAALEGEIRGVAQLRERDRLRGALLSSVGHDLRTPLTAIRAAAAELRRHPARGDDAALVASLEAESTKLDRYIANLLDMARIEAGAVRLKTEAVDLVDAVAAASRDLARTLAGHPLHVHLPNGLPLVRADPHLLHHCLINLLDNAARYSGADTAITVSAAAADDGGVDLVIEDEGSGLKAGVDPFDRFAGLSGSDRQGGAGLGLAIVKAFAEAMGLAVAATNRADRPGAHFSLRFPEALVLSEAEAAGEPNA